MLIIYHTIWGFDYYILIKFINAKEIFVHTTNSYTYAPVNVTIATMSGVSNLPCDSDLMMQLTWYTHSQGPITGKPLYNWLRINN